MKQKMQTWFWPLLGLIITAACATYLIAKTTGGGVAVKVKPNADGTTTVSFPGAAGKTYRVESSDDTATWTVVSPDLASSGGAMEWRDTRPFVESRFYRVTAVAVAARKSAPTASAGPAPVITSMQFATVDKIPVTGFADAKEAGDAARLQTAVNQKDYATVAGILRQYGVSDNTVTVMSGRFGQKLAPVPLAEPFLTGVTRMSFAGTPAEVAARGQTLAGMGFGRVYWVAQNLDTNWPQTCDAQLAALPQPPIGWLNPRLNEPDLIRFFLWYDRYAEKIHSVCLNGEELNNHSVKTNYDQANSTLNALFQLIKARKPDAFVWLGVTREYEGFDNTDVEWLQAMTFQPDGLQVWGLREFNAPFDFTRHRYASNIGQSTPMMVASFFGYPAELWDQGKAMQTANQLTNAVAAQAAVAAVRQTLAGMGKVLQPLQANMPAALAADGWRGMSGSWLFVQALYEAK